MNNVANEPVTVGNWMLTYLIMCIPIVNLVMLFVWAFSGNVPPSKANWAKASLIWLLIGIVLWILLVMVFGLGVAMLARSAS